MGLFDNLFGNRKQTLNKFNQAFFWGTKYTTNDDTDLKKYVDLAYNINPDVYTIVSQKSNKLISIPYSLKKIEDKQSKRKLDNIYKSTKYNLNTVQRIKALKLELKAMSSDEFEMPLDKPNANMSWDMFWKLSEIFLDLTGNVYWYMISPEDGMNKGVPQEIYVLPSHLIEIVLKDNVNLLSSENPIDYYILTEFNSYVKFKKENVVHIAIENPNFGFNGEHLYGQSPLRAGWKNIEATNKGLDLNLNTLKNGGVFGFIHGKSVPLTQDQATELKGRLKEMNNSSEDLSRIAGISAELGFTRLSLSADELKPFEYLKYNQKQLCNVLGWSDALLNNDEGGKYDKQKEERKRVVTDAIIPNIKLFERAFNEDVLPRFRIKDKCLEWNIKEIPELQEDLKELSEWIGANKDRGLMTANEGRLAMGMETVDNPLMDMFTVKDDIMSLEDAVIPKEGLDDSRM
jgi:HK97 family phage portal protein